MTAGAHPHDQPRPPAPTHRPAHERARTTGRGTLAAVNSTGAEGSQFDRFMELLRSAETATAGTSVRLPDNLRQAAALAADMGLAGSLTELTVKGLRDVLEAISWRLALDEHYRQYPQARPSLAEVAKAAAAIDSNPIANEPQLIERAASWVAEHRPDGDADDVLWLATGMGLGRDAA